MAAALNDTGLHDTGLKFDRPPVARGRFRLVDADAHIDPPHTFWAEYLPSHLRDMAPTIEEGDECDFVVFEGRKRPLVMLANQAGRSGKDFKMMGKLSDLHDSASPGLPTCRCVTLMRRGGCCVKRRLSVIVR